MNLTEALANLGLTEKEAKVYLALLQLERSTPNEIAKLTSLKRPTVYVVLEQLIMKGFVLQIPRAKKNLYKAEPIEKRIKIAEESVNLTKKMLPKFEAIQKETKQKVTVSYFEGMSGIKEMYAKYFNYMKNIPKEKREDIGFFAHEKEMPKEFLDYIDEVNQLHVKYKIKKRGITVYHPTILKRGYLTSKFLKNLIKTKAINYDKYKSSISIMVYGPFVQILSHRYLQGVLIENPDVSEAMADIFEMVWDLVDCDKKNYLKFSSEDFKD